MNRSQIKCRNLSTINISRMLAHVRTLSVLQNSLFAHPLGNVIYSDRG